MSHVPSETRWIDLRSSDDPRDVVHQAVACLAHGGLIGLASETVSHLLASSLRAEGLGRLRALSGKAESQPLALLLRGSSEAWDWVPGLSRIAQRLAGRVWPGPLTLHVPACSPDSLFRRLPEDVQRVVSPQGGLALCCSSDPFIRAVLELMAAPLVLESAPAAGDPSASVGSSPGEHAGMDMVVDSGPHQVRSVCTEVQVEDDAWSIVREGSLDVPTLKRLSGVILLFVCTGNTCRSPMAQAICKLLLARRLGCPQEELEARGYYVLSAGMATGGGAPAASHAIDVLRSMGGSLEAHRSQRLTRELVRQADCIFGMTADHVDTLLSAVPEASAYTQLLDASGADVPDPIGSDQQNYHETARRIEALLEARLSQMEL